MTKEDFEKLRIHCWLPSEAPTLKNVEMVFLVADTQDDRSVCGVFALDVNDNLYLIEAKELQYLSLTEEDRHTINSNLKSTAEQKGEPFIPIQTVDDLLKKDYLVENGVGIKPTFALIDRQGHRPHDIEFFSKQNYNVMMYQGTALQQATWRMSDTNSKLILGSAKFWQSQLIYYLYSQKKRGQDYLYFFPSITEEVIKQIVCVKPDPTKKFGDEPRSMAT